MVKMVADSGFYWHYYFYSSLKKSQQFSAVISYLA